MKRFDAPSAATLSPTRRLATPPHDPSRRTPPRIGPSLALGTDASDVESLVRAARGDRAAIARLYDRHGSVLLSRSRHITRDRSEAEDVLHDAFISIRDRAVHYADDRGAAIAWLLTLVRNLAIDRVRGRIRRTSLLRELAAEAPGSRADNPEALLATATAHAGVRRALSTLPSFQRRTLEAAFFDGLSYPEIAEREGIPLGTVKSRAARALTSLREALDAAHPRSEADYHSSVERC